ncbi:MAG: hypothetical protein A2744_01815 [Candidatus Buchananbacteria bacterium RIFCSPHIGHO2_01_FULL_44_11]|uniref:histidine kinase n=1 Tax=Candidatus Buchananbacteria bacterium RIFCSPHIGHO2_01_FULL_44_11 TaxID=1797535 RepID=A0A1G1Y1X2_9BACT|nr:MAG: hypothetical protein A2744_01815 [Candidatus Buchananbacteria bacterium RIFCSPHIGHO2_01_FULL_44_11]
MGLTFFTIFRYERDKIFANILNTSALSTDAQKIISQELGSQIDTLEIRIYIAVMIFVMISASFFIGLILHNINQILKRQRRFIANASHELQTPLSIIKTSTEVALLDKESLTKEGAIKILENSVHETDRLSLIIKNMLYLSTVERNLKKLPMAPINIEEVVQDIIERCQLLSRQKNINIIYDNQTNNQVEINANKVAIEQVLMNLLKNAIFHSPVGKSITLTLTIAKRNVHIAVRDHGPGIDWWEQKKIFEPFYKGAAAAESGAIKSGLGLTIVQEIMLQHGGRVMVKSRPGHGATFSILLPI